MNTSPIYKALRTYNDARAVYRAAETGSMKPVARRIGWRVYGRAAGKLGRALFGSGR
jgi:hypothetical protein